MRPLHRAAFAFAVLAFLVNPGLGCSGDDFEFGEAEMRAAVEGRWRVKATDWSLVVELTQATGPARTAQARGLVRPASACGNREFIRPAAACVESSTLPLTGRVIEGTTAGGGIAVTGSFSVYGRRFTSGSLELALPGNTQLHAGRVDATSATFAATARVGSDPGGVTVVLERLPR